MIGRAWRLLAVVALAAATASSGATAFAQSDRELATRQDLITQARDQSTGGHHAEALQLAKRAAAIRMSPSLRMFIAEEQSALRLVADAYGNARQCAIEAEADAQLHERDRILAACSSLEQELGKRVGRVLVRLPGDTPKEVHVTLGGEEVSPAALGLPYVVNPGKLSVTVNAPGYEPFTGEVVVPEGGAAQIDVPLVPTPAPAVCAPGEERVGADCLAVCTEGRTRASGGAHCCWPGQVWSENQCSGVPVCPAGLLAEGGACVAGPIGSQSSKKPWVVPAILGGTGVVLGAVATAVWLGGDSTYNTLKAACESPAGCTTATYNASGSTVRRDDAIGVSGWIAGGALVAAGVVWYVVAAPTEGRSDGASARLTVNPAARSVILQGTF